MPRILVVPDPLGAGPFQTQIIAGSGGKPFDVVAYNPNDIAPAWAAVLAAGNRTGARNPVIDRGQDIEFPADVGNTETAAKLRFDIPALGVQLIAFKTTSGTWPIYITGAAGGASAGGNVVISSGTGNPLGALSLRAGNTTRIAIGSVGIGFFGVPQVARPNVTGSRGGNAALASLLTGLANLGLITDGTTP